MSAETDIGTYRAAFAARRTAEPAAVSTRREVALARFEALGLPTRRNEAWRFTNVRPLQRRVFAPAADDALAAPALDDWLYPEKTHRIVLINGHFSPEQSRIGDLPAGARLAGTGTALAQRPELAETLLDQTDLAGGQAFASLNAALFADGFVLTLEPGVRLDWPVEIVHWGDAMQRSFHLRSLIELGDGAEATLIESFAGTGEYWTNAVTLIRLDARARLCHAKVQDEDRSAIHFGQSRVVCGQQSQYHSFVLTLGASLSRHDTAAYLGGPGADCRLAGAYLLGGEQDATNATFVDHAAPECSAGEVFKGVVDGRAHGAFLGRIAVRPEAQKTDAHQLNKNLLLTPRASVDTKPELEILADDVKCSHGATIGDLDEDALFYLQARGIAAAQARQMLIEAFAADALERIEASGLRAHLGAHVRRWLARSGD